MMRILRYNLWVSLLMLGSVAPGIRAQQQGPQPQTQQPSQAPPNQGGQPNPAAREPVLRRAVGGVVGNGQADDTTPQELVPDYRPIIGAQALPLGAPKTTHNFWQPYVDFIATGDSNALVSSTNTGWTTWESIAGGVDVNHVSGNSDLKLSYQGAASFSNDASVGNAYSQQLAVAERLSLRRYTITFLDQVGYLPASAFGYGGFGTVLSTGGLPALQGFFNPDQSILTARGQRISNSFVTQVDASLTPRSTVTFLGSYGLLHYFDQNLIDSHDVIFQTGYNYLLTRKDTVAVLYRFDGFRYTSGVSQSIDSHTAQLTYARRVTGRLVFQVAAGPDITFSRVPISSSQGASTGTAQTGATASKTRQIFWDANASATYRLRRAELGLYYDHGVSGGSGVLAGSITDNLSVNGSRQISRTTTGTLTGGYSRNNGLAVGLTSTSPLTNQTYDYWFAGANLSRSWGRSMNVSINYQIQYQDSNSTFCITLPCGKSFVHHVISFELGWHPRSIGL
jgi:hypothetical protein